MTQKIIETSLLVLMAFNLFGQKSEEDKFWNWFQKNEHIYFHEIENLEVRESIFDDLSKHLSKVNSDLAFEFSPIHDNGKRELMISAEGIKELFPIVEKLINKAPKLQNWNLIAFRQRIPGDDFSLEYGEFKIGYSDLYFRHSEQNEQLGIELNIRNFDDQGQTKNAIYILLDGLLGEYDVTTGIDWIEWVKLDESNIENLSPIIHLREIIDRRKDK